MQTCVYMSNCRIQAAVGNAKKGSISVKRLYETLAPEGFDSIDDYTAALEPRRRNGCGTGAGRNSRALTL